MTVPFDSHEHTYSNFANSSTRRKFLGRLAAISIFPSIAAAGPESEWENQRHSTKPIIVFDVNETLLDFNVLAPIFVRIFGSAEMLREWFNQVVIYSESMTLAGQYADSSKVGLAVLNMLAEIKGCAVTQSDVNELKILSQSMPCYADVEPALKILQENGFRLTTLSNNPSKGVELQLSNARIRSYFESLHSIDDDTRRYKPARESYEALAAKLKVKTSNLLLVSCHAFDILGAATVGCKTAMIRRPGNAPIGLGPNADFVGNNILEFAKYAVSKNDL